MGDLTRQQWDSKRAMFADVIRRCGGVVSSPETEALMNSWYGPRPAEPRPAMLRVRDSCGDEITGRVSENGEVTFTDTSDDQSVSVLFEDIDTAILWLQDVRDWKVRNG